MSEGAEGDYRYSLTAVALLKEFHAREASFSSIRGFPTAPRAVNRTEEVSGPVRSRQDSRSHRALAQRTRACRKWHVSSAGGADIFMTRPAAPQRAREAVAAYYACVALVDAGVGRILDALEQEGLADDAIVVFLGDHGFHLGEHSLWSKYTLFEQSHRAPLIIRVPGAAGNGKVCRQLVEFVDILPTLGELSGLDLPTNLQGASFALSPASPRTPVEESGFHGVLVEQGHQSCRGDRTLPLRRVALPGRGACGTVRSAD